MKKIVHNVTCASIYGFFIANASFAHAVSINEIAQGASIESYCSSLSGFYSQCLGLDKAQCQSLVEDIVQKCRVTEEGYPVPPEDDEAIMAFQQCYADEFEQFLLENEYDMDRVCEWE